MIFMAREKQKNNKRQIETYEHLDKDPDHIFQAIKNECDYF